ncbi:hypothetical protein PEDI_23240 [Persicobacter diffluens]|uniref:Uncharacterized protein n=1 Tax=Persicobacter diffluens TaxID=981 RepID=A0AAN4VZX0_9BACT|nr:hypothetical protein PEDI_23240 [Persicobacter diffluens]
MRYFFAVVVGCLPLTLLAQQPDFREDFLEKRRFRGKCYASFHWQMLWRLFIQKASPSIYLLLRMAVPLVGL